MLESQLFAGDLILQAVADDLTRISRTLNRQGEHVRKVQTALLTRDPDALPRFGADGKYGNETAAAVRRFKIEEIGVPAAQVIEDVGPQTVKRLDEIQAAAEQPTPPPPPPPQRFVRRDIWSLQSDANWHPIVLAYAKAVGVMKARPLTNPTSWGFQAAMHWTFDPTPPGALWKQCEHASWFFLPWHRMYVFAFERIVRAIVISQGGPADFALPYWNYDQAAPRDSLPIPFLLDTLPDGSANPLRVASPGRHPDWDGLGRVIEARQRSSAAAMAHTTFSGPPAPGFGGPPFAPTQLGAASGALELGPHNPVHVRIGGRREEGDRTCVRALMTAAECAALDPIFWLHHANIDRLWNQWIDMGGGRANPADQAWQTKSYRFHEPTGAVFSLACSQVMDTVAQLQYIYDDQTAPVTPPVSPVPTPSQPPQLGGASIAPLELVGEVASVPISVPQDMLGFLDSFIPGTTSIQLHVEDISATDDPGDIYEVFLDVFPSSGGEATHNFVGNVTFFGLSAMNSLDSVHTESPGLRHIFDITAIVESLASSDLWDASDLQVVFEPVGPGLPEGVESLEEPIDRPPVSIGRVSLFIG